LGDLVETITSGSRDWAQYYANDGAKFIRMGNLSRDSFELKCTNIQFVHLPERTEGTRTNLITDDLLFSITGEIGLLGLIPSDFGEAYTNQHAAMIRFISLVRGFFIPYILLTTYAKKYYKISQRGMKNSFRLDSISAIPLPLPPLAEQHRIATIVESSFTIINAIERNKTDLQSVVAATKLKILSLAIRGKLVPQDPNDEPASVLLERIRTEREKLVKVGKIKRAMGERVVVRGGDNSYYADVPGSWVATQLKDLAAPERNSFADGPFGSNLKKEHYTHKPEVRIIQLSNIGESGWRNENKKYTTFVHLKTILRSKVSPGDIVIAKMMPAGRAVEVPDMDNSYVLSSDVIKFVPSMHVDKRFLLYAINSSAVNMQILNEVQGIGRVRTSLGKMKKCYIPIPPFAEQLRIVTAIDMAFEQLESIVVTLT